VACPFPFAATSTVHCRFRRFVTDVAEVKLVELAVGPEEPRGRLDMPDVARPLSRECHEALGRYGRRGGFEGGV
jgi:hypothetical protein